MKVLERIKNIIPFLRKQVAEQIKSEITQSQASASYGGNSGFGTNYKSDGSKWPGGFAGSGRNFTYDHNTLMLNSRQVYQDSTDANALIKQNASDIAFTGLRLKARFCGTRE